MNFINEFGKQIREILGTMTPSARIMAGLMIAVVVVSLGWIMAGGGSTPKTEYLFGGRSFSDSELTAWEAAFGSAQLGDYERVGQRIRVPSAKKDLYLKALNSANSLPKEHNGPLKEALYGNNVFDPSSLIDKRTVFARQQQLENMIKQHAGVQNAIVSYDEQKAGFGKKADKVCTISVQGFNGSPVPPNQLQVFRKMATHTFAGLSLENVTVTDMGSSSIIHGTSGGLGEENPYFAAQTQYESWYENKLTALLSNFQATVSVSVQLDPTMRTQSELLQYQQQPVTILSSTSTKNSENSKGAPGGQPGAAPNGTANQPAKLTSVSTAQNAKSKESLENAKSLAGHEASIKEMAGLTPKTILVSIGIPESYYHQVAQRKYLLNNPDKANTAPPAPTEAELTAIRAEQELAVKAAVATIPVGGREGDNRNDYIKVYSYTDLLPPEIPGPTTTENALAWLADSWSTVALMVLVLISFGMIFSFLKSPVAGGNGDKAFEKGFGLEIPSIPIDQLDLDQLEGAGAVDGQGRRRPAALDIAGQEIKEDLSTIIKENPDAAVNLIKTWIGEAA